MATLLNFLAISAILLALGQGMVTPAYNLTGENAGDNFGWSLSTDAGTLAIGAPFSNGTGKVYIYDVDNGTLFYELNGSVNGGQYGYQVGYDGDFLVVTAPFESTTGGAIYFYQLSTGIPITNVICGTPGCNFGSKILTHAGSQLIVASGSFTGNEGVLAVFNITTGTFSVVLFGASAGDMLGYDFDFSGSYLVVGIPGFSSSTGMVTVYNLITGAPLYNLTGETVGDNFGKQVIIDSGIFWVGSENYFGGTGRVYAYNLTTGAPLYNLTGENTNDYFGSVINTAGGYLLLSATGYTNGSNKGKAYVYIQDDGIPVTNLTGNADGNFFGGALDLVNDFLVACAPGVGVQGYLDTLEVTSGVTGGSVNAEAAGYNYGTILEINANSGIKFVVGAFNYDNGPINGIGRVYVYDFDSTVVTTTGTTVTTGSTTDASTTDSSGNGISAAAELGWLL